MRPTKFTSHVLESKKLTPTVKQLRFSVPDTFTFHTGQFVSLVLPNGEKTVRRPYSVASSPLVKNHIDICIKKVLNGTVSKKLHDLKTGDEVTILGPLGMFKLHNEAHDIVFVSTGTGVSPFRSMIQYLLENGCTHKILLLTGYRHENEVLYADEFDALAQKYENFSWCATISQPKEGYEGAKGRVQHLIKEHFVKKAHYYICGLFDMIKEVEELLVMKKIPREHIFYERYD